MFSDFGILAFGIALILILCCLALLVLLWKRREITKMKLPVAITSSDVQSVNYHFTRQCNYSCGFCFHTNTNDFKLTLENAKKGLALLKGSGMRKINFAGGEPFLYPKELGEMCKYCKEVLKIESVSIVSNGSKIREGWMKKYARFVDILAVSCDSFDEITNIRIGRGNGQHVSNLPMIRGWCLTYDVKFKINTVVNAFNYKEDMRDKITELNPSRWKVFQVLVLAGENDGGNAKRDASDFVITKDQFNLFTALHKDCPGFVPENNEAMQTSYILLDERMRFLDCSQKSKIPSESILDVGVEAAFKHSGFDRNAFYARGGEYDWCKSTSTPDIEDLSL